MSSNALPSMEHEFSFELKGEESQKFWKGNFKYERPNLGKRASIEKMKEKLSEGIYTLPEDVRLFYHYVSTLKYGLTKWEEWWEKDMSFGLTSIDMNVVQALYDECMEFEDKWELKVYGKKKEE